MVFRISPHLHRYLRARLGELRAATSDCKILLNDHPELFRMNVENEECIDEVREWAQERQLALGFDVNYDLTPEGKILQELIDLLHLEE